MQKSSDLMSLSILRGVFELPARNEVHSTSTRVPVYTIASPKHHEN